MDKTSKAEVIYDYIRDQILSGRWKPGDRINDLDLSVETGVSRISVREALFKLTETGIIEKAYWKGYFIKQLDEKLITNIIETRKILEGQAIKTYAKICTPKQLNELEAIIDKSRILLDKRDLMNYMKVDFSFHEAIYNGQPNYIIANILNNYMLTIHMIRYISMGKDEDFVETAKLSIHHHTNILNALKTGNPEISYDVLISHLDNHKEKSFQEIKIGQIYL